MIKRILGILLVSAVLQAKAQYPSAEIRNNELRVKVYLPDSENGFYRGTRFDWSGVISSLQYKGHEYFGEWYSSHDPLRHDAITGPVEAFDPIDYDKVSKGESFLKIGVGTLKKLNNRPYRFNSLFEIQNGGNWKVKQKKDRIIFIHTLNDRGYAYVYKKTVRLTKNQPELIIEHTLKNTGPKPINTRVFNHNFFVIDKQNTGPDFSVSLPFKIQNKPAGKGLMDFKENKMNYLKELKKGESTMEYPTGFSGDRVKDYDFRIENKKTGAGVRITSDRPLAHFMYWSVPTTLSPEPFTKIDALPGKSFSWKVTYNFYETTKN